MQSTTLNRSNTGSQVLYAGHTAPEHYSNLTRTVFPASSAIGGLCYTISGNNVRMALAMAARTSVITTLGYAGVTWAYETYLNQHGLNLSRNVNWVQQWANSTYPGPDLALIYCIYLLI